MYSAAGPYGKWFDNTGKNCLAKPPVMMSALQGNSSKVKKSIARKGPPLQTKNVKQELRD